MPRLVIASPLSTFPARVAGEIITNLEHLLANGRTICGDLLALPASDERSQLLIDLAFMVYSSARTIERLAAAGVRITSGMWAISQSLEDDLAPWIDGLSM